MESTKIVEAMNVDMWNMAYYAYYYRMRPGSIGHSAIPLQIPIMENLQTIVSETDNEIYKDVATKLYNHNLYGFIFFLIDDAAKNGSLKKKYWDEYYRRFRHLRYSDICDEKSSIRERIFFILISYLPNFFYYAKHLKRLMFCC